MPKVPLETTTAAPLSNLFAEPVFNVPPWTLTFAAADVPLSNVVPLEAFTVPAPKFALTSPPFNAYVAAVNVEPFAVERSPPEIVNDATVSFPPSAYVPELMFTADVSATMLAAEVSNVPPESVIRDEAKATPDEILPPETVVVPVYP
jgi:hypothetical protein